MVKEHYAATFRRGVRFKKPNEIGVKYRKELHFVFILEWWLSLEGGGGGGGGNKRLN